MLLIMSMLVFTGVYVIGNPVDVLISPDVTQEMRQQVIQQYGLDLPCGSSISSSSNVC